MRLTAILFFFLLQQSSLAAVNDSDSEQQQLQACFIYSNFFGYNIDTIANYELYNQVRSWYRTPYKYAASSEKGIDCSGFVNEIFRSVYEKKIARSAIEIFQECSPIHNQDMKEGDLVFFKIRKKRISHVGVYLGGNKFAHASTQQGVIISDLSEDYYKKYFAGAGRIE